MKKIILMSAAALLMAGIMVSCGKSSKGKMDGEWNVDSITTKSTNVAGNGNTSSSTMNLSGTTYTDTDTDTGGSTTTTTGTVQEASYSIKKDGTWSSTLNKTRTEVNFGITFTIVTKETNSGNWDFAKGVGEFKKNERVLFSTLSSTTSTVSTSTLPTTTSSSTETYADGEETEIFVITESKKKSLVMTNSESNTYTTGGGTSKNTTETTITMSAK